MRCPMPANSPAPAPASATARPTISAISTASSIGEDPSEGFVRGRRFLHPKLGFTFTAPDGFTLDNTAQAVLGVKDGGGAGAAARRGARAGRAVAADYLNSGWIENIDPAERRGNRHQRLPGARPRPPTATSGRSGSTRCASAATSIASSSPPRTAPPRSTSTFRESIGTFRRMSPAGEPAGETACA